MTRGQQRMRATLTLMGTIIGAGVFAVPAMMGAWGVVWGTVGFWAITFIVLGVHLLLAEAVADDPSEARLAGLARRWIGPNAGALTGAAQTLQVFGTNLAYLILGGTFLSVIAEMLGWKLPLFTAQVLFWAIGAVTCLIGLSWMARVEAYLTWGLLAVMLLLIGSFAARMDISLVLLPGTWTLEPYGVFLFSLFGMTIIPELEQIVDGRREDLKRSVLRATLWSALLMYAFGVSAWLASSGTLGTSPADLLALLPPGLAFAIPLFGFLAVATSYITIAYDLGAMLRTDYRMRPWFALTVGLGVPLALLYITSRDFLATIGIVGAVFSAAVAVACALVGRAALRRRSPEVPWWWREAAPGVIIATLLLGGLATILR